MNMSRKANAALTAPRFKSNVFLLGILYEYLIIIYLLLLLLLFFSFLFQRKAKKKQFPFKRLLKILQNAKKLFMCQKWKGKKQTPMYILRRLLFFTCSHPIAPNRTFKAQSNLPLTYTSRTKILFFHPSHQTVAEILTKDLSRLIRYLYSMLKRSTEEKICPACDFIKATHINYAIWSNYSDF